MAENNKSSFHIVTMSITSSIIVAVIVAGVAYYGTSSSVSGTVETRLTTIESEVLRIRETLEDANSKRVTDLESEVLLLKAEIRELREQVRGKR